MLKFEEILLDLVGFAKNICHDHHLQVVMDATSDFSGVASARVVPTYAKIAVLLQSDCKF